MALSLRVATLRELQTVYGIRDLHDMLEVAVVDAENARRLRAERERREEEARRHGR